jgi:hypothetical protein
MIGDDYRDTWISGIVKKTISSATMADKPDVVRDPLVWNKMFKTDFFVSCVAPFPEHTAWEDIIPSIKAYINGRFSMIDDIVYLYRIHDLSLTRSMPKQELFVEHMQVLRTVNNILTKNKNSEAYSIWLKFAIFEDLHTHYKSIVENDETFFELVQSELGWLASLLSPKMIDTLPEERRLALEALLSGKLRDYLIQPYKLA